MSTILPYCPKCNSLMKYHEQKTHCEQCEYTEDMQSGKLKSTIYVSTSRSDAGDGIIYDQALLSTSKVICANEQCPSRDINKWGTYTESGFLIQPDMAIMNYHDRSNRINTYVCRICKTMNSNRS